MAGTYNPYGAHGMIWSAAGSTPYEDPNSQLFNLASTGAIGLGAIVGMQNWSVGQEGLTAYDVVQKHIRGAAMATPFGLGNTFRAAEFMSPHLSASAQGLSKEASVSGGGLKSVFSIGPEYTRTAETRRMLKAVVGGEAWVASGLDNVADGDYQLRFERDAKGSGRGSLFSQEVEYDPHTRKLKSKGKWKKLSDAVNLFELHGPADILDEAAGAHNPLKTNQAYHSVLQNLGITEDLKKSQIDKILSQVDPESGEVIGRSRFGLAPSIGGPIGTWGDLRRRMTMPGGYAAASAHRWNRLVDATLEQFPGTSFTKKILGEGGAFSVKVTPSSAPKMFAQLGLKGAKIGAAYMGVQQLDHWRRQYGLAGEVAISGGISAGIYGLLKKNAAGMSPTGSRNVAIASFFGQLLLPGFDQGIQSGLWTMKTKFDIGHAALGAGTMTSTYRRTLEGFLPGISSWETGAAIGLGAVAASHMGLPGHLMNRPGSILPSGILNRIGITPGTVGLDAPQGLGKYYFDEVVAMAQAGGGQTMVQKPGATPGTFRNPAWQMSSQEISDLIGKPLDKANIRDRMKLMSEMISRNGGRGSVDNHAWLQDELHARKLKAQATYREAIGDANPLNQSLRQRIGEIYGRYGEQPSKWQKVNRSMELAGTQLYHAFFGATMQGDDYVKAMASEGWGNKLGRGATIFAGAFALHHVLTTGIFGTMEGPGELSDIYSGKQMVAVKQGRFWEAGGTPFAGGETEYMRPHAYVLHMTRAREKARWGEGEDKLSPAEKFFYRNFTYEMERMTYHTRPYPMSSAAFSDVPIIGNILAATIGRVIKPPRLMHTNEWLRLGESGQLEMAHRPEFHGPSMALGGEPMGIPGSKYSSGFAAANAQYKFREIEGLTGWAKNMVQKGVTGTETFGTLYPVFGSAGSITDPIEAFWDMNLGGAIAGIPFTSEAVRRFLPRPQSEIDEYNPIMNSMPTWMPDRFKFGDPYRKVESGHVRLPGAGYAAIHPELQHTDPDNYPDIYKYAILSDIAPNSKTTMQVRDQLYRRRLQGISSTMENTFMDTIDRNLSDTMVARQFDHVHANAIELPGSGLTQAGYSLAQNVARDMVQPFEYMIPMGFRPGQKLMSDRGMIEQYEYERLYGTQNAFWNKPWRDWFRPSLYSAAHMMGYDGKPQWRQDADNTQKHFDELEFAKWMKLANQPGIKASERSFALRQAQSTRYGVNPQGDAMGIYMSLPDAEKKFFDAFTHATGSDRDRILEMIPEDQAHLYQALWGRMDRGESIEPYAGSSMMTPTGAGRLDGRYDQLQGQWSGPTPGPDWIGWHKDVEMDDVKLQYVENLGKDIYDYGLYSKQSRMMSRKAYMEGSDEFMYQGPPVGRSAIYTQMKNMARGNHQRNIGDVQVNTARGQNYATNSEIYYNDNRQGAIMSLLNNMME